MKAATEEMHKVSGEDARKAHEEQIQREHDEMKALTEGVIFEALASLKLTPDAGEEGSDLMNQILTEDNKPVINREEGQAAAKARITAVFEAYGIEVDDDHIQSTMDKYYDALEEELENHANVRLSQPGGPSNKNSVLRASHYDKVQALNRISKFNKKILCGGEDGDDESKATDGELKAIQKDLEGMGKTEDSDLRPGDVDLDPLSSNARGIVVEHRLGGSTRTPSSLKYHEDYHK